MTFPVVESVTESSFSTNTTNHTVDLPATVGAGNLLLMIFTSYGSSTQTTPSGWTALDKQQGSTTSVTSGVYARDADGSEGGTGVNAATSGPTTGSAHVYRVSGWGGTLADDVDISTVIGGTNNVPNPGSVTAGWGADDNLFIAICGSADDDQTMLNDPSTYSNLIDTPCGGGANASGRSASARKESTGATEDPVTFTLASSEEWLAWTVVIKPAGAPASTVTDIYNITWAITPTWSETEVPDSSSGVILAAIGRVVSGFIGTVVDPITTVFDPGTSITNSGATFTPSSYEICQRSGRRAKRGTLVREPYSGLYVLSEYYDKTHPQIDVRSRKDQLTRGADRPDDSDGREIFISTTVSADDL